MHYRSVMWVISNDVPSLDLHSHSDLMLLMQHIVDCSSWWVCNTLITPNWLSLSENIGIIDLRPWDDIEWCSIIQSSQDLMSMIPLTLTPMSRCSWCWVMEHHSTSWAPTHECSKMRAAKGAIPLSEVMHLDIGCLHPISPTYLSNKMQLESTILTYHSQYPL